MNTDAPQQKSSTGQEEVKVPSPPQSGSNSFELITPSPGVANPSSVVKERSPRAYRWSKAARDLVRANVAASGAYLSNLVTQLVQDSGYPRWACWRFVRRMGIRSRRSQRRWTQAERQRLEKLIDLHSVKEISRILHRSQSSVWHMIYRMGASATMGRDSFTKHSLAVALHVSPTQIDGWVRRGWLKAREVQTGSIKRVVIAAEDFCEFCRAHTKDAVGNRLIQGRLDFVYHFAFCPSHAELLPVRESKKERSAYHAGLKKAASSGDCGHECETSEEDDVLDCTA